MVPASNKERKTKTVAKQAVKKPPSKKGRKETEKGGVYGCLSTHDVCLHETSVMFVPLIA